MKILVVLLIPLLLVLTGCAISQEVKECEPHWPVGYRDIQTPCIGTYKHLGRVQRMVVVRNVIGEYVCEEIKP